MAKRTTMLFEDEGLLRGVREQAILAGIPMNQYIQDLIREDLRKKVGCVVIKTYSDGSTEETEMWSMYDASNVFMEGMNQIKNPSFTSDGQTTTAKRLESIKVYEHGELAAQSPNPQ